MRIWRTAIRVCWRSRHAYAMVGCERARGAAAVSAREERTESRRLAGPPRTVGLDRVHAAGADPPPSSARFLNAWRLLLSQPRVWCYEGTVRRRGMLSAGGSGLPGRVPRSEPTRRGAGKRAQRFLAASSCPVIRVAIIDHRRFGAPGVRRPTAPVLAADAAAYELRAISRLAERDPDGQPRPARTAGRSHVSRCAVGARSPVLTCAPRYSSSSAIADI